MGRGQLAPSFAGAVRPRKTDTARMQRTVFTLVCAFGLVACGSEASPDAATSQPPDPAAGKTAPAKPADNPAAEPAEEAERRIAKREIGAIEPLHAHGSIYFAGQPSTEDMAALKKAGIKTIVNLRTAGELEFDEAALAKELGLGYVHEPIAGAHGMSDAVLDRLSEILDDTAQHPVLVHCGAANRVGGVWLAHRLKQGATAEQAMAEARRIGLSSDALAARAKAHAKK